MSVHYFMAFDLGAESGRTILGEIREKKILIRELTRFANGPIQVSGHLHWNVYSLFEEIKRGMRACISQAKVKPESLAVDTWGVDFGLLAEDGALLGLPYAYRDARTQGAMEEFFERLPRQLVYELTGIQFMAFNSLFQLFAMVRDRSPLLEAASDLLFMPDLFTHFLTGERTSESTIASTSQLLDPRQQTWSEPLLRSLGIHPEILPDILTPGTVVGPLSPEVAESTGLGEALVIATASHDTASAIAAIPASGSHWAYISSGTWSLMGVEAPQPIITKEALAGNFTNEGGVAGTTRFLKNISGLWLLQQCRKEWMEKTPASYEELTRAAKEAPSFKAFVNPDWPIFLNPPSMPGAIRDFCLKTNQIPVQSPAETVRAILESLALKYRFTLDELRRTTARPIERIHVIGGGARNELLCQFTADATGLPVVAGPIEATATGNIMVQAMALGYVKSLEEIRQVVLNSVELKTFEPSRQKEWEAAYHRFQTLEL